jgi:hypothetical protein
VTEPVGQAWHTVPEAAAILRMSEGFILDRIRDKSLRAKRITTARRGAYRVSDTAIADFMDSLPDAGDP